MGGIIHIEYLFPDEFIRFEQTSRSAIYSKKPSANWRTIPFVYMSSTPQVANEADRNLFAITFNIKIRPQDITPEELDLLSTMDVRGCVIRYTTAEKQKEIIGSKQHPLFGPLDRVLGATAKDYAGYTLKLTGSSLYPPLPYLEL